MVFGCIAGWFLGETIYSFIVACSGYDEMWLFIVLQIVIVIIMGLLTWKMHRQVILWGTSGVGAYLFIRGFSYFIGGWPSMSDIMAMSDIDQDDITAGTITYSYFIYLGLIVVFFIFFSCW